MRAAGLRVELHTLGKPRPLPATAEATAYRIVQEGLTNTLKHAVDPTAVSLTVRWSEAELCIEITDDGRAPQTSATTGHGITGMAERAALFGGSLSAGLLGQSGWQVTAVLPLQRSDLDRSGSRR